MRETCYFRSLPAGGVVAGVVVRAFHGVHVVEDQREVVLARRGHTVTGQAAQALAILVQFSLHDEGRRERGHDTEHGARPPREPGDDKVAPRPHDRVQPHCASRHLPRLAPRSLLRRGHQVQQVELRRQRLLLGASARQGRRRYLAQLSANASIMFCLQFRAFLSPLWSAVVNRYQLDRHEDFIDLRSLKYGITFFC